MEKLLGISFARTYDVTTWHNSQLLIIAQMVVSGNSLFRFGKKTIAIYSANYAASWGIEDIPGIQVSHKGSTSFTVTLSSDKNQQAKVKIEKTSSFYQILKPTTFTISIENTADKKTTTLDISLSTYQTICVPTNICKLFNLCKKKSRVTNASNDNDNGEKKLDFKLLRSMKFDCTHKEADTPKPTKLEITKNVRGNLCSKSWGDTDMAIDGYESIDGLLTQRAFFCSMMIINFLLFGSDEIGDGHLTDVPTTPAPKVFAGNLPSRMKLYKQATES